VALPKTLMNAASGSCLYHCVTVFHQILVLVVNGFTLVLTVAITVLPRMSMAGFRALAHSFMLSGGTERLHRAHDHHPATSGTVPSEKIHNPSGPGHGSCRVLTSRACVGPRKTIVCVAVLRCPVPTQRSVWSGRHRPLIIAH
jgi:hypothetical protein